jgi:hypothetical protein
MKQIIKIKGAHSMPDLTMCGWSLMTTRVRTEVAIVHYIYSLALLPNNPPKLNDEAPTSLRGLLE